MFNSSYNEGGILDKAVIKSLRANLKKKTDDELIDEYEKTTHSGELKHIEKELIESRMLCPTCKNSLFYDSVDEKYYCVLDHLNDGT